MTPQEMKAGRWAGRTLIQEEWAAPEEIDALNALIRAGEAEVIQDWAYSPNYQCRFRKVRQADERTKRNGERL
jgi:hypothetical protein